MTKANNQFNHRDGITLKEFLDRRIESQEKMLNERFNSTQTAIDKAESSMNARLEGMNEFRNAMKDQTANFVTRNEMLLKFEAESKGRKDTMAMFISVTAFLLSIIFSVLNFIR